ncbi:hypothetical protein A0128_06310 [Leptospira tipperaryensis]|uniref:Uncharacterized protein n=1 Tax=Leptospira tipperaryensis TaxID=2564040 RepID=A0A1D7UVC5_9LEPT|nr:hypothetical protein A0128_06310 [Leptospira tipperaryensis]
MWIYVGTLTIFLSAELDFGQTIVYSWNKSRNSFVWVGSAKTNLRIFFKEDPGFPEKCGNSHGFRFQRNFTPDRSICLILKQKEEYGCLLK